MMRLAIIDDHGFLLQPLKDYLEERIPDSEVDTFLSLSAFEAAYASGHRFSLVMLDLLMPGHTELSALEAFRARFSDTSVIVLSATNDPSIICAALDAMHAKGYVPKSSDPGVFVEAIKLVLAGGIYIPPQAYAAKRNSRSGFDILAGMTARQRDVLRLLRRGMSDKLICRELNLSPNTIKHHKNGVFRALNVDSRTQAVLEAARLGLGGEYDDASARKAGPSLSIGDR